MSQSETNEWQSSFLLRLTGYGLLLLVLFDFIDILFPAKFMDPVWEFQTLGAIVERVPIPLLGLALVFYGEVKFRAKWELTVLNLLSLASLVAGIIFLLLIPLGLSDTLRIHTLNNDQLNIQTNQQLSQLQQIDKQLDKANKSDLEILLARFNSQLNSPDIKDPQELKSRLLAEVDKSKNTVKLQAEDTKRNQNLELLKSFLRWDIGALISGILFIRIWQATRWAREYPKRKQGW